ncbi:hypothetical protein DPMN_154653 [Dreissena polymorpha]|uniref:Uncharacterized protein n=1 Tax=Dreissena polymorpha TaxID=45954 RepID=A0A9D4FKW7_DREPO|nr:hypothetical protein DPMN_154653 [Dreissena polymorpha]
MPKTVLSTRTTTSRDPVHSRQHMLRDCANAGYVEGCGGALCSKGRSPSPYT